MRHRRLNPDPRLPVVLLGLLSLVAFVLILVLGRDITFYYDEWDFVLGRAGHSADVFLKPHNEHISVVPVLVYKVLFKTVGLEHHWPYLVVLALMHVALGISVFVLARRRVGPWAALIVTALLLFMGLAWQNMVWAFQIGFVGSVLGGVLALVALDTSGRRSDIVACVALVFSILCSSLGVPLALGVGAELIALRRRNALWVPLVPLVLYGVWYLGYGVSTITRDGLLHAAGWALSAAENAAGAPFGVGADWGVVLLLIAILAVGRRLAIGLQPTPRLLNLAVAGIAFWLLTGAARSVFQPPVAPSQSRYLTLGAIVFLLGAVELLRGTIIPARLLVYATGIAVICVWMGCSALLDQAKALRASSESTTAALGALQLSPGPVPPGYMPDPASPQILAGPYRSAVRTYDSDPADSPEAIRAASSAARTQADRVFTDLDVSVAPATASVGDAAAPPRLEAAMGSILMRRGCLVLQSQNGAAVATLSVPQPGLLVRASAGAAVEIRVRRYADGFGPSPLATVAPGAASVLSVKPDKAPDPYHAQLSSSDELTVCTAA